MQAPSHWERPGNRKRTRFDASIEREGQPNRNPARLLLLLCFSVWATGVDANLEPTTNVTAPKIEDLVDPSFDWPPLELTDQDPDESFLRLKLFVARVTNTKYTGHFRLSPAELSTDIFRYGCPTRASSDPVAQHLSPELGISSRSCGRVLGRCSGTFSAPPSSMWHGRHLTEVHTYSPGQYHKPCPGMQGLCGNPQDTCWR